MEEEAQQGTHVKWKGDTLEWDKSRPSAVLPLYPEIASVEIGIAEF